MLLTVSLASPFTEVPNGRPNSDDENLRHEGSAVAEAAPEHSRVRILVVEDDADVAETEQMLLESEGYEVSRVAGGEAAWGEIRERPPSLVVLDVKLPRLLGIQIARRVRMEERTRRLPVLFATAEQEALRRACDIPCPWCDALVKPFAPDRFLQKVKALLELCL